MDRFNVQAKNFRNDVFLINPQEAVIERTHIYPAEKSTIDVQGNFWTLAWAHVPKGCVHFYHDKKCIELSGDVMVYRAPFSVIHWLLKPGTLQWTFLVSYNELSLAQSISSKVFSRHLTGIPLESFLNASPVNASMKTLNIIAEQPGAEIDMDNSEDVLNDFKRQIDQTFKVTENIQDLLPANRNYSYMSREFKKRYGLSPVKYRNQLRLMQSGTDLMMSGNSVEWVYHRNGLTDPKYFYSRFKSFFGARPAQFRRTEGFNDQTV